MKTLCDTCYAPGSCCAGFVLLDKAGDEKRFPLAGPKTIDKHNEKLGRRFKAELRETVTENEIEYGLYNMSCLELSTDGRCRTYNDRPKICRDLEPAGSGLLCIHSGGSEGTGSGLY